MNPSQVTGDILGKLGRPGAPYFAAVALLLAVLGFGLFAFFHQVRTGLGVAGYQPPILWGVYITNFVFWIGITHSGTLISAVLFLFRARWRSGVARASEAMTVFAIMTGALFPIIHLGRPWLFYWLLPIPNERGLWVNFRSPIIWDLFAIMTYLTVSVVFLYVGMLPDIATARDRVRGWRQPLYKLLALGWSGTGRQWWHYNSLYALLAALAVPLAVSVHSVVSWDFATTLLPGWHSTIFAPYFVAGAIFSGVAMMITLLVPMRTLLGLEAYMRVAHFDNLGKLLLVMSLLLSYCYAAEYFTAWYSGSPYELGAYLARLSGPYAPLAWTMLACNTAVPLLLFARRVRTSLPALLVIAVLVNVGMWLERYVIVVSSLANSFDPATWSGLYRPTWVEGAVTAASFALFFLLLLVFVKLFPPVAMNEINEQARSGDRGPGAAGGRHAAGQPCPLVHADRRPGRVRGRHRPAGVHDAGLAADDRRQAAGVHPSGGDYRLRAVDAGRRARRPDRLPGAERAGAPAPLDARRSGAGRRRLAGRVCAAARHEPRRGRRSVRPAAAAGRRYAGSGRSAPRRPAGRAQPAAEPAAGLAGGAGRRRRAVPHLLRRLPRRGRRRRQSAGRVSAAPAGPAFARHPAPPGRTPLRGDPQRRLPHAGLRRRAERERALGRGPPSADACRRGRTMTPAAGKAAPILPARARMLLAALVLAGAGAFLHGLLSGDALRAWQALLVNMLFFSGLALAGVVLAALLQLTGARWGRPLKRAAEATAAFLPAAVLLVAALLAGAAGWAPWLHAAPEGRAAWLNLPFFAARELAAFLVLAGIAAAFVYHSVRPDLGLLHESGARPATGWTRRLIANWRGNEAERERGQRAQSRLAAALLMAYIPLFSLVGFDFVMALDAHWYSALLGGWFVTGNLTAGAALLALVAAAGRERLGLGGHVGPRQLQDAATLLFGLSILWAYMLWSQYLVIWYGDLPEEARFVHERLHGAWAPVGWTVFAAVFAVPFVLLLSRAVKQRPAALAAVATLVLAGVWLERFLLVAPSLWRGDGLPLGLPELLVTAGTASLFALCWTALLERVPTLPLSDPKL